MEENVEMIFLTKTQCFLVRTMKPGVLVYMIFYPSYYMLLLASTCDTIAETAKSIVLVRWPENSPNRIELLQFETRTLSDRLSSPSAPFIVIYVTP